MRRSGRASMGEVSSQDKSRQAIIRSFWRDMAKQASNRWTTRGILEFELALLAEVAPAPKKVLDLGSGHGELSRRFAAGEALLTAVDFEDGFRDSFSGRRERFILCDVLDFESEESWDVVMLMGVALYLTGQEAYQLYKKIGSFLESGGIAIIKHQVTKGREKIFQGFSENLGRDYWGRYPNLSDEYSSLARVFSSVEKVEYPKQFNGWPDTEHVAFLCRKD